jgi:branched-chain amino acid transport system ATP-binding protein
MLRVSDIVVNYGGVRVLDRISFDVKKGETICLLGANGSGKTTAMKAILGSVRAVSGQIHIQGIETTGWPSHRVVNLGVSVVPENRRIFPQMTVNENLELGYFYKKNRTKLQERFKDIFELFPKLKERRYQVAGTLSGGEQQMLSIGRALMSTPTLLLLDEPSLGLAPIIIQEIYAIIKRINESGTTILLVEQNAKLALDCSTRGYILETGRIVFAGSSLELMSNERIVRVYLGIKEERNG